MFALSRCYSHTKNWGKGTLTLLGLGIILLAGISYVTNMPLAAILAWAQVVFGWSFSVIFSLLLITGIVAIKNMSKQHELDLWFEIGQQAANGISTLALTFTLLGISLGIGSLSEHTLTADTIQSMIGQLTQQFSTAFMTTVVGLPAAAGIRATLGIRYQSRLKQAPQLEYK